MRTTTSACPFRSAAAKSSSRWSRRSGSWTPKAWPRKPPTPCETATSASCRSASKRNGSTGWTTSRTGASPASSGGATRSPPGTTTAPTAPARASSSRATKPRHDDDSFLKNETFRLLSSYAGTRTCWTRGFRRACGRSRRWGGPTRPRRTSRGSIRRTASRPATTFCSSGWRAWSCSASSSPASRPSTRSTCTASCATETARK
mmetsp:Transcript_6251/g.19592  ORF Transcript_6251/g.19592 Transcript_6251/m.19592 type:complete len:204 (-) Transcript_6251:1281-1892(-)